MKFIRGVVHSAFLGTPEEAFAVKKLLSYGRKKTHIDDDGFLYTGLVDFLQEHLGSRFPIEVSDLESYQPTKLSLQDINIPDDYITFEDPAARIRHYQLRICLKALLRQRGIIECATGCFTGDTKIPLLDGTTVAIADLVGRPEFWVYSTDKTGKFRPGRGHSARVTKIVTELVEVTLDTGEKIRCTPEHRWLLRDNSYAKAEDLLPGSSLFPLYRGQRKQQYSWMREPSLGEWLPTHRVVGRWLYGDLADNADYVIHHEDHNKKNNTPSNLRLMTRREHSVHHSGSVTHRQQAKEALTKRNKSEEARQQSREKLRAINAVRTQYGEDNPVWVSHVTFDDMVNAAGSCSNMEELASMLSCSRTVLYRILEENDLTYREFRELAMSPKNYCRGPDNHKVVSIRRFSCTPTPVYDITVDETENFALDAGVVVHNSGKTEMAAIIMKYLVENGICKKIYVITGTNFLMDQAATRFEKRGLQGVSRFSGEFSFNSSTIQVCVVDSLTSALQKQRQDVIEDFDQCDAIFFDEAHHAQAETWIAIGERCQAKWRFGLTATIWSDPFKYSHEDFYLIGLTGGVIAQIPSSVLRKMGYLADPLVTMIPVTGMRTTGKTWPDQYDGAVVKHIRRNSILISLAKCLYASKRKVLLFVGQVNHGLCLLKHIREQGCKHVYFVKGGSQIYEWMPSGRLEVRDTSIEQLAEMVKYLDEVVLIGTQVLDEGVDIPSFDTLIMGTALKKYRRTVQRAGRGMRPKPGENKVYIFDTVDNHNDNLSEQSSYRIQTYKLEEFEFSESLDATATRMNCELKLDLDCYDYIDLERRDATRFDPERKFDRKRSLGPYGY